MIVLLEVAFIFLTFMTKTTKWLVGILATALIVGGFVYSAHYNKAEAPVVSPVIDAPSGDMTTPTSPSSVAPQTTAPAVTTKNPILGTEWGWVKTTFGGGQINPGVGSMADIVPVAGKFAATFGTDLSFSSTTDCNSLKGKYIVDDEVLSIGALASTKMACGAGSLESEYTKELGRVTSYVINGNEMRVNLVKDTGTMIFTRRVKAIDPAPVTGNVNLNGSTFRLTSFNGVATPADSKYTLSFTGTNLSAKFCNGLGGTYTLANGTIKSDSLVGTLMYCDSPAGLMTTEQTFSSILGSGATLAQSGSNLTLTGSKGEKFVYTVFMD
jgi:heat shock protein HslJ